MWSVCLIPFFAIAASAQHYAITDLLGHEGARPSSPTQPAAAPQGDLTFPTASSEPETVAKGAFPTTVAKTPTLASNPGKAMASLLGGLAGPMAMAGGGAANQGPYSGPALSSESMAVVSGLVESFMHKVKLEPGERSCLENNVRQVSGDVMGTVGDVVTAVKALMKGKGTVKKNAAGGLIGAGIDAAMKITSLVTSSMSLIKNCVHGDALKFLNMTAHHMIDGKYLEDRFIVNGVDIARSLSDTIIAYEAHDFHRLGQDVGLALRKILLSNAQNATRLPEGMPEQEVIEEATSGLMKGFFARGAAIQITDKADPDVHMVVDLHQCIAGNSAFFKELWLAAWNLVAQLSANGQQHELGEKYMGRNGQPKWQGELMIALMQFPTALANCGVAQDVQEMFQEAIKTLGDMKVQVNIPRDQVNGNTVADDMAQAVEAWTNWNFQGFGYEIGKLLRELVMLALPQKYSVDASGRLQRATQEKSASVASSMMIIGGAATSLLVVFAVVRTHRSTSRASAEREGIMSDTEAGGEEGAVE